MGLLDSKTRILDTILTVEGRRQLSAGGFKIARAAISDRGAFYEYDSVSGSSDATKRLYLEANSAPGDIVTFLVDDSGKLQPSDTLSGVYALGGKFVSGSTVVSPDGDAFASLSESLVASSIQNLSSLSVIGTIDDVFEDDAFILSRDEITFYVTDAAKIAERGNVQLKSLDPLYSDKKMSLVDNYTFLPPIVAVGGVKKKVGAFTPRSPVFERKKFIADELRTIEDGERSGASETLSFDTTSRDSDVFTQFFEVSPDNTLVKLDTLVSILEDNRVLVIVGKVMRDDSEYKFIRIFSVVFE